MSVLLNKTGIFLKLFKFISYLVEIMRHPDTRSSDKFVFYAQDSKVAAFLNLNYLF